MLNKLVDLHEINIAICRPDKKRSWRAKLQHAGG